MMSTGSWCSAGVRTPPSVYPVPVRCNRSTRVRSIDTKMADVAPAAKAAANQLEALKSMSKVVADTGDIKAIKLYKPVDATTNPSLLLKAMQMPEYQHYLRKAIEEEAASGAKPDEKRPFAPVVDRLAVSVGTDLLKVIPGRVSTEVDANLSYDTEATVAKARRLIALYQDRGVAPERVYIKIAATWEGIQACKQLQQEGIDCNLTLLFSFAQGVACANAKAALISPFVGRILDWYKKRDGRDFAPHEDPGVLSVKRIYRYYKRFGIDTVVMAASFRNVGEIRELAGCDNITISPALLRELEECTDPLPRALNPATAATECEDESLSHMDEALFRQMHEEDQMALDKLKEGIEGFAKDQAALEQMLADLVGDQKIGAEDEQELYI